MLSYSQQSKQIAHTKLFSLLREEILKTFNSQWCSFYIMWDLLIWKWGNSKDMSLIIRIPSLSSFINFIVRYPRYHISTKLNSQNIQLTYKCIILIIALINCQLSKEHLCFVSIKIHFHSFKAISYLIQWVA